MSTLIEPRSPLLAQAAWPIAALRARTGSASQLLALRALVASHLICFADSALRASVSASHLSHSPSLLSFRETRTMVQGRWAVHGYGIRTTPQYPTLGCSGDASIWYQCWECFLLPLLLAILLRANILWWSDRALRRGGAGA